MFQPLPIFVGLRYSLAREHSFFVSFITWVSLLGVALGVAALITVLSVMNGFERELRDRILGMASHATISALRDGLDDWQGVAAKAQQNSEVEAIAPYVEGEAMLREGGKEIQFKLTDLKLDAGYFLYLKTYEDGLGFEVVGIEKIGIGK